MFRPQTIFPILLAAAAICLPRTSRADATTLPSDQKLALAQRVYDQLVLSIGDGRPAPHLRLREHIQVAMYVPQRREIDLDERAIDLCLGQPDPNAALAVLLGHELAHYYGHHGWTQEFGNSPDPDLDSKIKLITGQDLLRCEMEADYYGGFYGYMSGYDTLGTAPKLIQAIYQRYDQMPGYPSMKERQDIARQAEDKLDRLLPVFDAGNLLLELRQYPEAMVCFDRIALDFPSREIVSNAGVARAQYAMMLLGDAGGGWAYPFQLDADTRLHRSGLMPRGILTDDQRRQIRALLIQAQRCFDNARTMDPAYTPAYLNLAGTYDLLDESELAAAFADKAAALAGSQHDASAAAAAQIMLGIIRAHAGKNDQAKELFHAAQAVYPDLVAQDLAAMDGPATRPSSTPPGIPQAGETIAGASPEQDALMDEPPYETVKIDTFSDDQPSLAIRRKDGPAWIGFRISTDVSTIAVLNTRPGSSEQSARGIRVGATLDEVRKQYGSPQCVIAARQCNFFRYDAGRIIFQVGADGRVQGWSVFAIR